MNTSSNTAKMSKSPSYHHGNLRQALIDNAICILEEEGLKGLGLRAVARRAGVSQAAPYNHFKNKDGMLAAIAAQGFAELDKSQQLAIDRKAGNESTLVALGRGYINYGLEHPALLQLMFGPQITSPYQYPELADLGSRSYRKLTKAIEEHLPNKSEKHHSIRIGAVAAWSVVHGLVTLMIEDRLNPELIGEEVSEALIDQVINILVNGL